MQKRHGAIPPAAADALIKARQHSEITLRRTRTAIGGVVSLAREDTVATLLQDIAESPLVLVTGPAGSGKSALAKLAISHVADSAIVLAFSAEEFAVPHLDHALLQAQIPANAKTLDALLAGQSRKILLIESVERLLEANSRDAFEHLLTMCAADTSWQIVLTCRDYSVDIVRSSLLDPLNVVTRILRTPPLTDVEIDAVVKAIPSLARPATSPFLHELFRTPYILDKAARMQWPEGGTLPNDERAFREKFWRDIVRRDDYAENAMPRRRHEAFVVLCVRRAKALDPFAACADLDAVVLQQLRNDNLIDFSPATEALAAPSHDVLEDWAVVEWIAERFAVQGSKRKEFAEELGTYPAIRRAYRKWLDEFLNQNAAGADVYILGVVGGDTWAFEGPIFVAAVCVRDHWADLTPEDREWCTETLLAAVKRDADASDFAMRISGSAFDSASRAALVLPLILSDGLGAAAEDRILKALVTACTHPNDKVANSAASGIGRYLGKTHPQIVQGFVGLFARQSKRLAELEAIEVERPYTERRPHEVSQQEVRAEIRLIEHWTIPCTPVELASVPTKGWLASQAYQAIMAMLLPCPTEPLALQAFQQVAAMLSAMWQDDRNNRGQRNFHFESDCEDYLAHFARKLPIEQALQVIDPVLANIDKSPKEVASFVKDLVIAEDNAETTGSFWPLWSELARRILKAPWLSHLEQRYPRDEGLLRGMFLGLKWNDGVTHWHCLEGHSQLIDDFFEKLPAVVVVFSGYLKFLCDIGERSLPNAFLPLERKLRAGTASKILSDSNVVFYLETILKRYVYGKPDALKQDNLLKNAALYLLDQLVDAGSSTAYRMRDDFVTPGSSPVPKSPFARREAP